MTNDTTPTTSPDAPAGASGEVRAKRCTFTAAEKLRILHEAERCPKGELGALLRREGIYSSHLTTWRRERDRNQLAGLSPRKSGPKVDEQAQRLAQLEREKARLEARLTRPPLPRQLRKKESVTYHLPKGFNAPHPSTQRIPARV